MRTGSRRNATFKGQHRRELAWFSVADSLPLLSISAPQAARKIVAACRRGAPHLIVGLPSKIVAWANEVFPDATARAASLASRVLPAPKADGECEAQLGADSASNVSESVLTILTRKAALGNNELPGDATPA